MLTRRRLNLSLAALSGLAALPAPSPAGAAVPSLRLAVSCSYEVEGVRRVRTSDPFVVRLDSFGTSFEVPDAVLLPTSASQSTEADGRSSPVRLNFRDVQVGVIDGVAALRTSAAGRPELVLRVRQIDLRDVVMSETSVGPSIALPSLVDRRLQFAVAAPQRDVPVDVPTGVAGFGMTVAVV